MNIFKNPKTIKVNGEFKNGSVNNGITQPCFGSLGDQVLITQWVCLQGPSRISKERSQSNFGVGRMLNKAGTMAVAATSFRLVKYKFLADDMHCMPALQDLIRETEMQPLRLLVFHFSILVLGFPHSLSFPLI